MSQACEHTEVLLSSWMDGELNDFEEGKEMLDHLVRCRSCRGFYRDARALEGMVIAADVAPPEADSSPEAGASPEAVWRRIESEAKSPQRRWLSGWMLKAAALAVVAVGVALVASRMGPGDWGRIGSEPTRLIEVEVGSRPGEMTEARFFELTTEILEADARYRRAMREVMDVVGESGAGTEGGGDRGERAGEIERSDAGGGRA